MRATSQKRGKNGTRDRSNARRHPKTRAKKRPPRVFSTIAFILRVLLPRQHRHFLRARERERERENSKDKTPTGDTQKKKERDPECAPEEEDTCAVPLAKLLPAAENMFFRAFDAVETCAERRVPKKKRWQKVVVPFFMRVGVAKVGAFPFYKEKTRERRGETLNPKLPKGKKKSAFTKMPSGIDGRERERDVFDETPKERERSTPRRRLLLLSPSVYYTSKKKRKAFVLSKKVF